ncbi:GtrA family protein [Dyella sp. Tek66A03]|uniref:GtrA family protein n=1 Tax=Dyella sp. Tek66A03 TaxID=3458298 RepID=UPI00403EBFAD
MSGRPNLQRLRRFFIFLLVGGLNTLFGFAVYAVFVIHHSPTWLALIGGNIAGMVFNFFTTGHFVFLDVSPTRIPRFASAYLLIFYANLELISVVNRYTHDAIISQAYLTPIFAVISYLLLSRWVFSAGKTD